MVQMVARFVVGAPRPSERTVSTADTGILMAVASIYRRRPHWKDRIMDDSTLRLIAGALLFAGAALVLLASLLPTVEFPVVSYVAAAIGLFAGVYLIGISHPDQSV